MKCGKCGKNEATMHYKETINGVTKEIHLCQECAESENLAFGNMAGFWSDPFHSFLGSGFGDIWGQLLSNPVPALIGEERRCPSCGLTESELRETGRVGCPECYNTFADILNPYVKKVHGATRHIGSAPVQQKQPTENPVEKLKAELKEAVEKEEYERAASLRDEIKRLESNT